MSRDRFIRLGDTKTTIYEVEGLVRAFFDEVLKEITSSRGRLYLTLVGKYSNPTRNPLPPEPGWEGRHLEVFLGEDYLDVITRQQDTFTNGAADALARTLSRFYGATLEMD